MKYPAMYQSAVNGNVILLFTEKQGVVLDKCETVIGTSGGWDENKFTNITAEHIANTYGEVKSKDHAHFIVELGEGAGYELCGSVSPNDAGQFIFDAEHKRLYFTVDNVKFAGMKQITIPLPSECKGVEISNDHEFEFVDCTFAGNKINAESEWPKVGSKVTWGTKAINGEVRGIDNGLAWIKNDHGNYVTAYISELQKPKTPEQELEEDLINIFQSSLDSGHFVGKLISKYNITKKGEGDEF